MQCGEKLTMQKQPAERKLVGFHEVFRQLVPFFVIALLAGAAHVFRMMTASFADGHNVIRLSITIAYWNGLIAPVAGDGFGGFYKPNKFSEGNSILPCGPLHQSAVTSCFCCESILWMLFAVLTSIGICGISIAMTTGLFHFPDLNPVLTGPFPSSLKLLVIIGGIVSTSLSLPFLTLSVKSSLLIGVFSVLFVPLTLVFRMGLSLWRYFTHTRLLCENCTRPNVFVKQKR